MKRRIPALLLAMLVLSGCSSLLNRDYRSVRPHLSQTSDVTDSEEADALRAQTYAELVNDVQYYVTTGVKEGIVHLYGYPGPLDEDLDSVCAELLSQDPLCSWALEDIQWERSHLPAYEECVFYFSYRIDPEEITRIHTAVGSSSIRELVSQTMSQFEDKLLLKTSSYYGNEDLLLKLVQEAYNSQPGYAMGFPQVSVYIYPSAGQSTQRLVELDLTYPFSQARLQEQAQRVTSVAATMVGVNPAQGSVGYWLLYSRLSERNHYDPEGIPSVYAALVSGRADSQGVALAYQYLCQRSALECLVVQGTLDGSPHCWNMVSIDGIWRHVDVTANLSQGEFLSTDADIAERYTWDTEQYPACPDSGSDDTAPENE